MGEHLSDRVLARCLDDVARTGDIESVLRRYPRNAQELRPLLQAALTLNAHYADIPEPAGRLRAGRERLLAAAAAGRARPQDAKVHIPQKGRQPMFKIALAVRLVVLVLSVVMGTTAVGGGTVWAARGSVPGDLIYPVKTSAEDVQLALSTSLRSRVELALRFAAERVREVQQLIQAGQPVPERVMTRAETQLRYALTQAEGAPSPDGQVLRNRVAEQAQEQAMILAGLRQMASPETQSAIQDTEETFWQVYEKATSPQDEDEDDVDSDTPGEDEGTQGQDPDDVDDGQEQAEYRYRYSGDNAYGPGYGEPSSGPVGYESDDEDHGHNPDSGQGAMSPSEEREREQAQEQEQTQQHEQEQNQEQEQEQSQERSSDGSGEQEQDQDRDRDQSQDQDQSRDQDQDQSRDQDQDQSQEQDQDQEQDQGQAQDEQGSVEQHGEDNGSQGDGQSGQEGDSDHGDGGSGEGVEGSGGAYSGGEQGGK